MDTKNIITLQECADLTGYSPKYLYQLTSRRIIPHYKRGNKLYFNRNEIERWLTATKVQTIEEITINKA